MTFRCWICVFVEMAIRLIMYSGLQSDRMMFCTYSQFYGENILPLLWFMVLWEHNNISLTEFHVSAHPFCARCRQWSHSHKQALPGTMGLVCHSGDSGIMGSVYPHHTGKCLCNMNTVILYALENCYVFLNAFKFYNCFSNGFLILRCQHLFKKKL